MKTRAILFLALAIAFCPFVSFSDAVSDAVNDVLRWRIIQITGKDMKELITTKVDKDGVHPSWMLSQPVPNMAYIEANAATAKAYLADYDKTEKAAIKEVTPEVLKAILAVLIEENNELRVKAGLPPRTEEQVREAIRRKLQ